MVRKYAILKNQVITEILSLEEEQVADAARNAETIIDIEDMLPLPAIGYILNGNTLQIPQGLSSREEFEIELNNRKSIFGSELARESVNRIGARNKILNKTGAQVTALLTTLLGVKSLMETGALGTARNACNQLKYVYTEYTDIFDLIIQKINAFEATNGL